jgi:hypothetical protein
MGSEDLGNLSLGRTQANTNRKASSDAALLRRRATYSGPPPFLTACRFTYWCVGRVV